MSLEPLKYEDVLKFVKDFRERIEEKSAQELRDFIGKLLGYLKQESAVEVEDVLVFECERTFKSVFEVLIEDGNLIGNTGPIVVKQSGEIKYPNRNVSSLEKRIDSLEEKIKSLYTKFSSLAKMIKKGIDHEEDYFERLIDVRRLLDKVYKILENTAVLTGFVFLIA